MIRPEILLGPPGTGKTTALLKIVEQELERGTPSDRIGFISFTRKAAEEARERALSAESLSRFKLTKKDLPHFRTIHSFCFSALGISSSEMFEGKKILECADWLGVEMSGRGISADEGGISSGYRAGDRILFMDNLARVRGVPLREQYALDNDNLSWALVDRVSRGMEEFKKKRALHDFTDLLQQFVDSDFRARLDVLIVDERQDCSYLQCRVIDKLARDARRVVLAGDDDQSIFQWSGADVPGFVSLEGDVTVLGQSWRVPRLVQDVASDVISRVKNRRPKTWRARTHNGVEVPGEVVRVGSLDEVDFSTGQQTLVLARNLAHLRDDAVPLLTSDGILFEQGGFPSVKRSVIDAILNWERLRRGERISVDQAEKMYDHLSVGSGVTRGHKKLPALQDREAEVSYEDLRQHAGLVATGIWHEALDKIDRVDRAYMVKALRSGQKLTERPPVRLSTIHGSKGGEAEHVVVMRDVAYRTARETPDQWEAEARVFYVAVTRAKQKLTIVAPQTRHSYDL